MADLGVEIDIIDAEGFTVVFEVRTDAGAVQIIGDYERVDRHLVVRNVHIQGSKPGGLGRARLNAIARQLKELTDVDTLEVHGAVRTTGANRGRPPRPILA